MSLLDALAQGATVVTAGRRHQRHLRLRFDRSQAANGETTWLSPDILSWGAWLERLWTQSMLAGGRAGELDLLTARQSILVWRGLVDARSDLPLSPSAISMAAAAWQLSRGWLLPVNALREAAFNPDTEAFASWAEVYETRCSDMGWIDLPALPELLIEDLEAGTITVEQPVVFAGFESPTPQQARLFDAVPSTVHRQPFGGNLSVKRLACPNPQAEHQLAARWARDRLEESPDQLIGIVATDLPLSGGALRRTCLDRLVPEWRSLARRDLPVDASQGSALGETGLIHTGLLALQLGNERIDYRDLGQLLRSPYLLGSATESAGRASLDLWLREKARLQVDLRWVAAAEVPRQLAPGFVAMIARALEWAESEGGSHEPGGWASRFHKLLRAVGWPEASAVGPDERDALDAWNSLLDDFASCGRVVGKLGRESARHMLVSMAKDKPFEPNPRTDGLQILSPEDAQGHEFDSLWVCGLSSDAWPAPARPNPLIALDLQRRAKIPQADPQLARQNAYESMRRLWASAGNVTLSWPQENDQGELVCSTILDTVEDVSPDSIPAGCDDTFRTRIFDKRQLDHPASDPAPPLRAGESARGGSRLMKLQGACPARAFFEFRLGAREMPTPAFGINPLERGTILHDVLEKTYESISASGGLVEISDEALEEIIDTSIQNAVRPHFAGRDAFDRALLRIEEKRTRDLVMQLVAMDRARTPFAVEAVERGETVEVGPLELVLRQDRVDRTEEGAHLVIDYKSGKLFSIGAWRGERPVEPQLPLYAATGAADGIAVIALNRDGIKVLGVGNENFGMKEIKTPSEFADDEAVDWQSLIADWRRIFEQLASEYASGDVRIDRKNTSPAEDEFAMLTRIYTRAE
jgi:ATP-dependent helicase/nuclease subunit B